MTKHDRNRKTREGEEKKSSHKTIEIKVKDGSEPLSKAGEAEAPEAAKGEKENLKAPAPAEIPEQEDETENLKKQVNELNDRFLRKAAEFENFRKRMEREKQQFLSLANAALVGDLLPVLDNFERALTHNSEDSEKYRQGVEMIFKQLKDVLAGHGIEKIKAAGEHFNPELHEAMMSEPSAEHEEGEVIEVLQNGYTLRGRVLRPARVKVAAAPPDDDNSNDKEGA